MGQSQVEGGTVRPQKRGFEEEHVGSRPRALGSFGVGDGSWWDSGAPGAGRGQGLGEARGEHGRQPFTLCNCCPVHTELTSAIGRGF